MRIRLGILIAASLITFFSMEGASAAMPANKPDGKPDNKLAKQVEIPPVKQVESPPQISLWPTEPPGGGGPRGEDTVTAWGSVRHVVRPDFQVFLPKKPNGGAALIIAGGGYKQIAVRGEGVSAAKWLNGKGYAAFVLTYRLPGEGWKNGPLAPLQDAQRAMRLIRFNAKEYGIDDDRVGIVGFSAGGHLAGMTSVRSDFSSYEPVDAADKLSDRPDWSALVYPVITLEPPYNKLSSLRQLLGRSPNKQQLAEWSVETYVNRQTPPIFLAAAADDPIVNIHHSEIMKAACDAAHVPTQFVRMQTGGHGFALGRVGTDSMGWTAQFATWLKKVDGTTEMAKR